MRRNVVSIVIPVYNTEQLLERCLQSLTGQTYANVEAILVDDGSTDGSLEVCRRWEKKDARIRCFSTPHIGAAAARNLGVEHAEGEFLSFLDSDDWWEVDLLEKAVDRLREDGSDVVWFDMTVHWPFGDRTSKRPVLPPVSATVTVKDYPGILSHYGGSMCDKLMRMEFFRRQGFSFPQIGYNEDNAVAALVMLTAEKVSSLRSCAYHYDKRHSPNDTVSTRKLSRETLNHMMKTIADTIAGKGLFEKNRLILEEWFLFILQLARNAIQENTGAKEPTDADARDLAHVMDRLFPEWRLVENRRYLVWGSYNLRTIVNYLLLDLNRVRHYQFSSLVGALSRREVEMPEFRHPSPYRRSMIDFERTNDIVSYFADGFDADIACIDFLEERFPLLDCGASGMYTLSDAMSEADPFPQYCRILPRGGGGDSETLWRASCLRFIEQLSARFRPQQVILVKTYLAENFGEYGPEKPFAEAMAIREANSILADCYGFFEEQYKGIHILEAPKELLFSDVSFKHGCAPWHLNDFYYYAVVDAIRAVIRSLSSDSLR